MRIRCLCVRCWLFSFFFLFCFSLVLCLLSLSFELRVYDFKVEQQQQRRVAQSKGSCARSKRIENYLKVKRRNGKKSVAFSFWSKHIFAVGYRRTVNREEKKLEIIRPKKVLVGWDYVEMVCNEWRRECVWAMTWCEWIFVASWLSLSFFFSVCLSISFRLFAPIDALPSRLRSACGYFNVFRLWKRGRIQTER